MTVIDTTTSAELRRLISTGKITLNELLERLAAPVEPPAAKEAPKPKQIVLSPADKTILRTLPKQLADLELPSEPRILTTPERSTLVPLFDRVKIAKSAITKAEDVLKEVMHGHIDSVTDGPVGENGHKLTEGEVVADDYDKKVVRGITGGNAVNLTEIDLQELEANKKISHKQYLAMTKLIPAVRVLAPEGLMAEINKDPGLLDVIAEVATRTAQNTAVRMAKN